MKTENINSLPLAIVKDQVIKYWFARSSMTVLSFIDVGQDDMMFKGTYKEMKAKAVHICMHLLD